MSVARDEEIVAAAQRGVELTLASLPPLLGRAVEPVAGIAGEAYLAGLRDAAFEGMPLSPAERAGAWSGAARDVGLLIVNAAEAAIRKE